MPRFQACCKTASVRSLQLVVALIALRLKNTVLKGILLTSALLCVTHAKKDQTTSCLLGVSYGLKSLKKNSDISSTDPLFQKMQGSSGFSEGDLASWKKPFMDVRGKLTPDSFGIYSGFTYKVWAGLQLGLNVSLNYGRGSDIENANDPITKNVRKVLGGQAFFSKDQALLDKILEDEKNLKEKPNSEMMERLLSSQYKHLHKEAKNLFPDFLPTLVATPGIDLGYEFNAGPVSITPIVGVKCDLHFSKDPLKGWDRNQKVFLDPLFSAGLRLSAWGIFAETTFGFPIRKETKDFDQFQRELSYQWKIVLGAEF